MTFVTTPTDVLAAVSWIHWEICSNVSRTNGIGAAVLRGAIVGAADGYTLVAARTVLATDAVGTPDGAFVA
jgi:hypothetical protein